MPAPTTISENFFQQTTSQIKRSVVKHMVSRANELRFSSNDLDEMCGLGQTVTTELDPAGKEVLPRWDELVKNPDLLTSRVFSRTMVPLDLEADALIPVHEINWDERLPDAMLLLTSHNQKLPVAVVGAGRGEQEGLNDLDLAKVYVLSMVVKEFNKPTAK